jgi:ribosomal protein S18 acetylase RimI-like enzyme
MSWVIRPVAPEDITAISRICLLTADAGRSAETLYSHDELPGLVWALPYVLLPPMTARTWGFVLVDPSAPDNDHSTRAVKGYILGTTDSRAHEAAAEALWWPPLRRRFPLESGGDERTEADERCISIIHRAPDPAHEACLTVSPAHMHINLLPEVQRRGWGIKLIGTAVDHLRGEGISSVWLGLDERNTSARKFYEKVGFKGIIGAPNSNMALDFNLFV